MSNSEELHFQKLTKTKKTGYLNENFRLFHVRDRESPEFEFHYHDFHKIVIFISGNVTYLVEGKAYYLKPWDVLLVSRYAVHKPVIRPGCTYERIVIWIRNDFLTSEKNDGAPLSECLLRAAEQGIHLIRPNHDEEFVLRELLMQLELSLDSSEFATKLLCTTLFQQLLICINRIFLRQKSLKNTSALRYDKQIDEILHYINHNLTEDLSNEALAERFYLSRYHLMHKFKKETGYTLHNYIEQKRLVHASADIRKGIPVMKAAKDSGFKEYSTFLRAFRKKYGMSPKEYRSSAH